MRKKIQTFSLLRKLLYWVPSLTLMLLIFLMSERQHITVTREFVSDFIIFKSLHVLEYALLTVFNFQALRRTTHMSYITCVLYAVLCALAYGIFDEIHQTFVPTRSGVPRDVVIDLIGICIAATFLHKKQKLLSS